MGKKFIQNPESSYFLSSRCINREWFRIPMDVVWEIAEQQLFQFSHAFNVEIHAFVLMGNHYHMLVTALEGNLSHSMGYFQREFSREISRKANRINRIFNDRFGRTEINSYHHFQIAYKYLYRNPVKANLCEKVEQYAYSSLRGLLGMQKLLIPMAQDDLLFDGVQSTIDWLNTPPDDTQWDDVRKALRRKQFALPIKNKVKNPLETTLL